MIAYSTVIVEDITLTCRKEGVKYSAGSSPLNLSFQKKKKKLEEKRPRGVITIIIIKKYSPINYLCQDAFQRGWLQHLRFTEESEKWQGSPCGTMRRFWLLAPCKPLFHVTKSQEAEIIVQHAIQLLYMCDTTQRTHLPAITTPLYGRIPSWGKWRGDGNSTFRTYIKRLALVECTLWKVINIRSCSLKGPLQDYLQKSA